MKIYILLDRYTEDMTTRIYGAYETQDKARVALEDLSNTDTNGEGYDLNENKTARIEDIDFN